MTVDCHTHNFPDRLASRALEVMCAKLGRESAPGAGLLRPVGDGTVATELRDMDRAGVDFSVNCPVATRPHDFEAIYRRAMSVRDGAEGRAAAERIVQLGSVHPCDPDFAAHVEQLRAAGIPGIKIHPNYQGVRLDDPALVPFFTALRDAGLFAISHTGFDPGYIDAPPAASPVQIAALLAAVPGLRFVAAHLGGECGSTAHATDALLPFPNCWIDTAAMYFRADAEETRRVLAEWPADRIVFGTDYFWHDPARRADWVRACRPDPADQEKIFHLNAEKLLGIEK